MRHLLPVSVLLLAACLTGCKKYQDTPGASDPRLNRPYCNDPHAVNYNWAFPGKPDNTTCIYAADVFAGNYLYSDSVYDTKLDLLQVLTYQLQIRRLTDSGLSVTGLCPSGAITLKASRTLIAQVDSVVASGQVLCRPQDTVSGNISRPSLDSAWLSFNLTLISDTGIYYHRGSAVKQ